MLDQPFPPAPARLPKKKNFRFAQRYAPIDNLIVAISAIWTPAG